MSLLPCKHISQLRQLTHSGTPLAAQPTPRSAAGPPRGRPTPPRPSPAAPAAAPAGPSAMFQGSGAKHRLYHQSGVAAAASSQPGDRLSGDDTIVITASGVAPTLPSGTPGGSGGPGPSASHYGSPTGSAAAGGPGGGHVGLPYQRINVSSPPAASTASIDEGLARSAALSSARRGALCDSGLPDPDMCALGDLDLDEAEGGGGAAAAAAPPPTTSFPPLVDEALSRGRWLLGLLIVQSTSSFVLDAYQDLLRDHLVVTLFLTMLVGAGGNAGNQSAIKVIRGLATGVIRPSWRSAQATMREQAFVGLLLGTALSAGGFVRVYLTHGDFANAAAISFSLLLIVMTSVVLGTGLPFALAGAGVDPANAGTSIQVLMDILGVAITCVTCHLVLVQLAAGVGAEVGAAAGLG